MKSAFLTPCVTAFHEDGSLDLDAQAAIFDHLMRGGVDGVLVMGSMGEFFSLNLMQRRELMAFSVSCLAGRTRVLVGTASMNFEETVSLSNEALSIGADAVMVITPYYFKLSDTGIERFYDELAGRVKGPLYLYNYPDRTNHDLSPETALRLRRKHGNIIGLKDSAGTVEHTLRYIRMLKPLYPDFEIYCGFDRYFPDVVRGGGNGAIGGLSNAFPQLTHEWVEAFQADDGARIDAVSRRIDQLMPVYDAGLPFIPYIKEMTRLAGVPVSARSSFPFPNPTAEDTEKIRTLIRKAGFEACGDAAFRDGSGR